MHGDSLAKPVPQKRLTVDSTNLPIEGRFSTYSGRWPLLAFSILLALYDPVPITF